MPGSGLFHRLRKATYSAVRLAARPVRHSAGKGGVVVQPYRGYGSRTEIFLIGRVFRQSGRGSGADDESMRRHLRDIGRRISRRGIKGAKIAACFKGASQEVETDRDGYFRIHLRLAEPVEDGREWHAVRLTLEEPEPVEAEAQVFIPPDHCRYVVISDIDDTIMYTGVANRLGMLWRLFVADADSRTAFPGVSVFYRALHDGVGGDERNPMLYVSRGPWGIYDMLDTFFQSRGIPVGPILFLREWGLRWSSPLPRKAVDHKRQLIDRMLELYDDLPVILIGDSGQHDPEVYRQVIHDHCDRILAVYIRNVSKDEGRVSEIEAMAEEAVKKGSSLLLASDSTAMAEHACGLGLIDREAVESVRRRAQSAHETHLVEAETPEDADAAVEAEAAPEAPEEPANVVVEPGRRRAEMPPRAGDEARAPRKAASGAGDDPRSGP
ncbi:App1 family protein [Caenispirillum salinarum]|uniref:App1 family protein n=1 Tax=Caenispirillum salinarum TaxID=859058 RepID=UPI00384C8D22